MVRLKRGDRFRFKPVEPDCEIVIVKRVEVGIDKEEMDTLSIIFIFIIDFSIDVMSSCIPPFFLMIRERFSLVSLVSP